MERQYFGAIINGGRFRVLKRKRCDPKKPTVHDVASSMDGIFKADFAVDLKTKIILKDRTGMLTNFDSAPILTKDEMERL